MSFGLTPKNFMGQTTTQVSIKDGLAAAFKRATAGMKSPAKVIARTTGKTPEMAERWLRAENAPSAEALIIAMREYKDVWDAVKEMAGRADTESEAEQILAEITARLQERRT